MQENVKNLKISILGASRSGIAAAVLLKNHGADVFVSELAKEKEMESTASVLRNSGIAAEFGGHSSQVFNCDFCVISPGISINSDIAVNFKKRDIPVYSELEVASWFIKGKIIAVTGSNGKSTVTSLTGEILNSAGLNAYVAGNIGTPLSSVADKITKNDYAVVEVSSFQLEAVDRFKPDTGIFLNLTPDHLNRHGTMEEYGRLKALLFKNQTKDDAAIYYGDSQIVHKLMSECSGNKFEFGLKNKEKRAGFVEDGILTCIIKEEKYSLLRINELGIKGEHNVLNALAASLVALIHKVEPEAVESALKTFKGLSHRMEFIREVKGVKWYNDSKATNVDSVIYALNSFSEPVVLIAGGRDKDSDFTLLKEPVKKHVKKLIVIGEAAQKIERALVDVTDIYRASSMQDAVNKASKSAEHGDVVLLSPACASFDMFENFEHRGDVFRTLVRKIEL